MSLKNNIFVLIFSVLAFSSCQKEEDEKKVMEVPAQYDGSAFQAHAAIELKTLDTLKSLIETIESAENPSVALDFAQLSSKFQAGNLISNLTVSSLSAEISGGNGLLKMASQASGKTWTPADSTSYGGVYGPYFFNGTGLDLPEMIEKSLFGGMMYQQVVQNLSGTITVEKLDKALAIIGANPSFPNTSTLKPEVPNPDVFLSKYVARRDKNDGNGFYSALFFNFRRLQAAVKAEDKYPDEKELAKNAIKANLEKAMAATVINYCISAQSGLSKTNIDSSDKASALHALGEAIGLLNGMIYVTPSERLISNLDINQLLGYLNYKTIDGPKIFRFALRPERELPKLQMAIDYLKNLYNFSDSDMDDFAKNWISVQNR